MTTPDDDLGRLLGQFRQTARRGEPDGLLETVLARTARTKRRSRWLIADTWRPDVAIPRPPEASRRALWLAVAIALIVALTVGLVAIGSQRRLPPPFGPARAGLLAFDSGGDIVVAAGDGTGRLNLTSGPAVDSSPSWSLDGRKIAFWRRAAVGQPASLRVIDADGSHTPRRHGRPGLRRQRELPGCLVTGLETARLLLSAITSRAPTCMSSGPDGSDLHRSGPVPWRDPTRPDGRRTDDSSRSAARRSACRRIHTHRTAIGIWVVAPDGTGQRRISVAAGGGGMPYNFVSFGGPGPAPSWSPDGRTLRIHHRPGRTSPAGDWPGRPRRRDDPASADPRCSCPCSRPMGPASPSSSRPRR
jgi:hypothetical protein